MQWIAVKYFDNCCLQALSDLGVKPSCGYSLCSKLLHAFTAVVLQLIALLVSLSFSCAVHASFLLDTPLSYAASVNPAISNQGPAPSAPSFVSIYPAQHSPHVPTEDHIYLNNTDTQFRLINKIQYLEDQYPSLSIEDVLSGRIPPFENKPRTSLNADFTKRVRWLRFTLNGSELDRQQEWIGEIQFPAMYRFSVYVPNSGGRASTPSGYELIDAGSHVTFSERAINHRHVLFKVSLNPFETKTVYIRAVTTHLIHMPITLWEVEAFNDFSLIRQMGWGGFFGMILLTVLYNLITFFNTKERSYLLFALHLTSIAGVGLVLSGLGFQLLWSNSPSANRAVFVLSFCSLFIFAAQFTRMFLNTKNSTPVLDSCLQILSVFGLSLMVLSLSFPQYKFTILLAVLSLTSCGVIFSASVECVINKVKSAEYFLAAWLLFMAGMTVQILSFGGYLPINTITLMGTEVGAVLELILVSLAMSHRLNLEKTESTEALELHSEAIKGRRMAEGQLYYKALHDDVTGLPNRKMLQQKMPEIIDTALQTSAKLSVIILRFSRLQEIYNALGPKSKEKLFKLAAHRLTNLLENFDARVSLVASSQSSGCLIALDDHSFVFVCEGSGDWQTSEELEECLASQLYSMSQPFDHRGMLIDLDMCIGLAFAPEHGLDVDTLLQHAEIAAESAVLRSPKIMTYSPKVDPYSAKRLALMGELREAIIQDKLLLEFQPQLDLVNNSIVGAEALLRWYHPSHGHIRPEETIRMAEQSGQLKLLTQWILNSAFRQAAITLQTYPNLIFCVNLSSKNLREPDLLAEFSNRLIEYEIDPANIKIEVTESEIMEEPELALTILTQLAATGIGISIDDFGTGYSSLTYLSALPVTELKIDKSFIQTMRQDEKQMAIVRAAINMTHDLGLKVVAEGVEDLDCLNTLRNLRCDTVQGYFVSRPIPGQQLVEWMNRRKNKDQGPQEVALTSLSNMNVTSIKDTGNVSPSG